MPIYEYQCLECGKRTEAIQRLADAPLTTCTECNGPLKKLISSPAFQFKGSGWYVTDYARSASGEGKETKSSEGKETKTSEGKETKTSEGKDGGDSGGSAKEAPPAATPAAKTGGTDGGG